MKSPSRATKSCRPSSTWCRANLPSLPHPPTDLDRLAKNSACRPRATRFT
jgi:hypothetical protein